MHDEEYWIKRLSEAARLGSLVDLTESSPGGPDVHMKEHASKQTRRERWIPASAIRSILTSSEEDVRKFDPRGLRIHGARIVGPIDWSYIKFPRPLALTKCAFTRTVRLHHSEIRQLNLGGCSLPGISLDGACIAGDLDARATVSTRGFHAAAIRIDGQLMLQDANLQDAYGPALFLDGARISRNVRAENLNAQGMVRAVHTRIDGKLNLSHARLSNMGGMALLLDSVQIANGLNATGMTSEGEVRAIAAHIDGQLVFNETRIDNPSGWALVLNRCQLDEVFLCPGRMLGQASFADSSIATLRVSDATLPHRLHEYDFLNRLRKSAVPAGLDRCTIYALGWKIGDLHGSMRSDPLVTAALLDQTGSRNAAAEPRYAVAAVYDRIGRSDHARLTRLIAERRTTQQTQGTTAILRRLYGATAGYGYRPFLPAIWLMATLVVAAVLVFTGQDLFVPADRDRAIAAFQSAEQSPPTAATPCTIDTGYPCFNSIGFTLQNVVPAASGPLRPDWVLSNTGAPAIAFGVVMAVLRLLAWVFAALTLAAATGLLRRH